ncbi:hypothetical protein QZH41_011271 [Actinostola sp. cb2023]|nr:hypothetical protein QZH41_011271 [Actinostola sp. cb2023]
MASTSLSSRPVVHGPCFLSEEDVLGSSLNGRKPVQLKNSELTFWLKCRGDSCKGLQTKALLVKRIDPKLGLVQVGSTPAPSVETQYGKCPVGSYGSYQLGYTESNFKVWENLETVQRRDIDMAA